MARGCRDCSRCTESTLTSLIALPFRLLFLPLTFFTRAVVKKCPDCGHPLSWHARRADGSFKD